MSGPRGPGEQWPALESVGLSRKELALAEALQMEYDALSRLRQDKEESRARKEQLQERPLISWDDPADRNGCAGIKATRALSGSDPTLSYNGPAVPEGPQVPPGPSSESQPWQKGPLSGDYLFILEGSQRDFLGESLNGSQPHNGSGSPKKLSPPPLPPRHPLWGCPEGGQRSGKASPLSPKGQGQPRDINMFSVAQDKLLGRRISQEDPYGVDAITCLNLKSTYESQVLLENSRGWKEGRSILEKESSGKPVARSKTMPPQVPPRTCGARAGNRKNLAGNRNRRISVEPVAPRQHSLANGYELFEVSEERDEEVAAFCHMLDVKHALGSHEHIQHCRKFDIDIRLQLLRRKAARSELDPNVLAKRENRERIVESLTAAILNLVELYCSTFNADFQTAAPGSRELGAAQEARLLSCPLSFTVYATHRIPITWAASYEDFYLSCSLSHGGKELCSPLLTRKAHVYKYLFHLIIWDQQICFPVQVNRLPRETLLSVTLFAVPVPPPGSSSDTNKQRRVPEALGWVTTPLFNFRQVLTCGRKLLGLWPATQDNSRARSSAPNFNQPDSVILQIDFPTSAFEVKFTNPPAAESSPRYEFGSLGEEDQRQLREAMQKKSLYWLTDADRQRLWEKRCHCHESPGALPMLLASAPSWDWGCLPDIYALLSHWSSMSHQDALGLLHATFPDQEVRRTAVQWIDSISDTELLDYLPQLVQALKYECYLDSPLVRFLMKRAICDLKVTHYFFWLLKDGLKDSQFSIRYQYLLAALLCCCGKGLREEFDRQCLLVSTLARLAQQVRDAAPSARQGILREGLEDVAQFFKAHGSCRLPLSPSLLVKGIVPRDCSYFNSNAVPLKLSFQNVDPLGENIRVIFKCGDDLRQDMLTLQMIRIMNKIWVQEGLDMRMVIFRCFSTGRGRGMVEMIPNAETLRKIQVEHGVTGSFKDRPLADWLQKHNPKEDEYEKAVENFIYSCAGCCVATYVLGICDRHNDNIMLKTTGHMFHIDFGRFLGHAQMFGNIKRDRAPFVFTSDMAYVINGGDKPSSRFHDFVDLCCQAYNLIRKHTHLFLNLLGLMLSCGIPELSDLEDLKYVYDALRPQDSDADATTYFTRLIESSLGSVATKLNFFIHNLAQMKFTGSEARPSLSFAPRTHTLKTSGRIRDVFLCRHERVFNPSKGYTYVVKVQRDNPGDVTFVQRTFEEFQELHNKLRLLFPSSLLPSFPSRFVIGRSRGEAVAERRKEELNGYIWHLIHAAPEVAECDLIYTFFHPLPRDEKAAGTNPSPKPADATWARSLGKVGGEVKLSISYKNNKLFIMVMHIRGLPPLQDGNDPDPYVKTYLLPDPQKTTKRKTKVARKTCNPTYNEMLVYDGIPRGDLEQRELRLSVLSEEGFWENILLGEVGIRLRDLDLAQEKMGWFALGSRGHGTL
ncbi:PREDICTED: phosphatidylinositol 4-phosphate 3-kinase C2 domain-containing subunit beta [Sturnus vulgaris]|uniref:phosphatidylinositol 4-phosphate 3-kinase C2 domain-containing subunit beta n=1 Tax=Sturnus vulgaris TaxID=9172 RepID=UPI00071A5734|nr:PREDICTED: phosphatidylinositol 4-phosphate 3-kinase C2 domain-containing subunit beta [Sturnus vulgaris]